MNQNETSDEETHGSNRSKTEKRAEYEAFEFRVPAQGVVRVENASYGDESDEHVYVVEVGTDGDTTGCTCPADEYQAGRCKHRLVVENAGPVVLAASATDDERDAAIDDTASQAVATDGGREECVECGGDQALDKYGGRCALCGVKALRDPDHPLEREDSDDEPESHVGRGEVVGSEAPDMGGGPTSGVDEL